MVLNPMPQHGLGYLHFARRYFGNRFFFLFLRLLRCFSSPGFLLISYLFHLWIYTHYCIGVPPFGYLRIFSYLHFPAAFRSLSRPSSAPVAKASTLCSFSLNLTACLFNFILLPLKFLRGIFIHVIHITLMCALSDLKNPA